MNLILKSKWWTLSHFLYSVQNNKKRYVQNRDRCLTRVNRERLFTWANNLIFLERHYLLPWGPFLKTWKVLLSKIPSESKALTLTPFSPTPTNSCPFNYNLSTAWNPATWLYPPPTSKTIYQASTVSHSPVWRCCVRCSSPPVSVWC